MNDPELENYQETYLTTVDQKLAAWGGGEWAAESDEVTFTYRGFDCEIVRIFDAPIQPIINSLYEEWKQLKEREPDNPARLFLPIGMGHLCGYIKIPSNHPWFQKEYDQIDGDVHGGLTYGQMDEKQEYCIGFDCAHSGDVTPSSAAHEIFMSKISPRYLQLKESQKASQQELKEKYPDEHFSWMEIKTYKNISFVINELKSLVDQAITAIESQEIQSKKNLNY